MSAELQDPRFTDETAAREALEKIVGRTVPFARIAAMQTKRGLRL